MEVWDKEIIPDTDLLYMRVHEVNIQGNGKPMPCAFKDQKGGMSTDWNKYSTPQETLDRTKRPGVRGVIQMVVKDVKNIPNMQVAHTPDILERNRAHTDVIGEKDVEARLKFLDIFQWVIPVASRQTNI